MLTWLRALPFCCRVAAPFGWAADSTGDIFRTPARGLSYYQFGKAFGKISPRRFSELDAPDRAQSGSSGVLDSDRRTPRRPAGRLARGNQKVGASGHCGG